MQINICREEYTQNTTLGRLYIDGEYICYVLEDTARPFGVKVKKHTCIPEGEYNVGIRYSGRFKREMPVIYTEKDKVTLKNGGVSFKYVQIHGGNTHANTESCPLVAYKRLNSSTIQGTAEAEVTKLVKKAIDNGEDVTLEVVNYPQPS